MLEENGRSSVYVLSKGQSISDPLLPPSTHCVETLIPGVGGGVWAEDMLCVSPCYGVISVCFLPLTSPGGWGDGGLPGSSSRGAERGPGAHPQMEGQPCPWGVGEDGGQGIWPLGLETA